MPERRTNDALQELHESVLDALLPMVADDCAFTAREWVRERFHAHLTLAMADIPPFAFDEIAEFVLDLGPIGPAIFPAEVFQLVAFESDDWSGSGGRRCAGACCTAGDCPVIGSSPAERGV